MEKIRILVLDRGFVGVCRCPDPRGVAIWLAYRDWRTIRRWGTERGLGQLVKGPTDQTVLDDSEPTGLVPVRAIIRILDVDETAWESHLPRHSEDTR